MSGWLVSDDPAGEEAGSGGAGLVWLHVAAVVRPVGRTAKVSKIRLEVAYGEFFGNSSGGHSCSQHANCTFPQNLRDLWLCVV